MINLDGKAALVTGGSRGIGRATALLLAEAGARVAINYHSEHSAAAEVVGEIEAQGGHAIAIAGSAESRPDFERVWRTAEEALGALHILVINAGIWRRAAIDEMTDEELEQTLAVNLKGAFHACRVAAQSMKERRFGNIILVSSTAGQRGEAHYSHYAASKGGLISLTKSLAAELGPLNIRVNCVAPGWVLTDMTQEVFRQEGFRDEVTRMIPLRRIGTPADIAGPILFLASDLAQNVQGEVLNVNGGSVLCG